MMNYKAKNMDCPVFFEAPEYILFYPFFNMLIYLFSACKKCT